MNYEEYFALTRAISVLGDLRRDISNAPSTLRKQVDDKLSELIEKL